jgi:hypothetical protein
MSAGPARTDRDDEDGPGAPDATTVYVEIDGEITEMSVSVDDFPSESERDGEPSKQTVRD